MGALTLREQAVERTAYERGKAEATAEIARLRAALTKAADALHMAGRIGHEAEARAALDT